MGWSRQPNLEILCQPGLDFDSQRFEQQLLEDSREITDAEFSYWADITDMAEKVVVPARQPELDSWRPITRDLRDLELAYQGRQGDIASADQENAALRDIERLAIPPGLTLDEVRAWALSCLLSTPFANSVLDIEETTDARASYGLLAEKYNLSMTEARRAMEAVQNWLAFLSPHTP